MTDEPKPWAKDHDAGYELALTDLRQLGFSVDLTCSAAPVQLEGRLPNGKRFYFRCRHEWCSLSVGGDDPAGIPEWDSEIEYGDDEAASFIPASEAMKILRTLLERYGKAGTSD